MASTAVLDPPADHQSLRLESIPLIDLNLLSQTELFSLSLCSSSSSHPHRRCDDDVLIPKIDRSVFNESAGSRKQTYSRLRLAPRNSQPASSATITRQTPLEPLDQEKVQIIGLLKQLFASETHDDLVPVRIDYNDNDSVLQPFNNVLQTIPIDVVFDIAQKKRKRGRPRKDANLAVENHSEKKNDGNGSFRRDVPIEAVSSNSLFCDAPRDIVGDGVPTKRKRGRPRKVEKRAVQSSTAGSAEVKEELVHVNRNGGVVDLVALGNMEDPFGDELRKRTEGLETEAELLGFLEGLEGEWVTNKKNKIVQASEFGDALPRDWKIMLSIERKEGRVYLFCRRYNSPNGQQFLSCKEVSSYLLAYFGFQDASQSKPGHGDSQVVSKVGSEYDANFTFENDKDAIEPISCSPVLITSMSTDEEKQATLSKTMNPEEVQNFDLLKCHICMMTFSEKNGFLHHLSSHEGTANRCNCHSSISEGVIVKDEKYECQFCHKIIDEWIQYKGYVKSNEVLEGLSNTQKSSKPVLNAVSLTSLKMQESIGTEKEKTSNSEASFKLNYSFADCKLKEDADVTACTDRENHRLVSFFQNEQVLNCSKDEKDKKNRENQHRVCNMTNHNLGKLDESIEVSVSGSFHLVAALASNNENKSNCESSDEINAFNCISNERSGGLLVSVDKEDKCSELDIEHSQITSRVEDKKVVDVDEFENYNSMSGHYGPEDIDSNVKQQSRYQGFSSIPSSNVQSCGSVKDGNGNLNSILLKSVQVSGSEIDICSSSSDKQTCVFRNNVNNVGAIGNGGNHVGANVNAVSIGEPDRILGGPYRIPTLNKAGCVAENFAKNPNCMRERPLEENGFESDESTPLIVDESIVANNVNKSSIDTANVIKVVDAEISKNSKLTIAFGNKDTGIDADIIPDMEQEGTSKGCLLVLSSNVNEHTSVLKDNVICSSKTEELKKDMVSPESYLPSHSGCGQSHDLVNNTNNRSHPLIEEHINKSFWNNEELHDFGSCNTGIDVDTVTGNVAGGMSSEGFPPVIGGKNQTISIASTVPGVCISTVEELNLKRGSEIGLICPSGSEQINASENNVTMVHSRTLSNQPTSEDLEKSRNDDQMNGLGNISQPSGEVMSELIWRTEEQNVQWSRSADTSSALMQLSGCFPNFDILADKGANGVFSNNENFESTSGLGHRLGSIRPSEYNFLTSQGSSQSNESKVLYYDAEMGKGYDPSLWIEKEALSMTTSRNQTPTVCAWCRDAFHHEAVNPETHSGSMGIMCATCQFNFSSELNPL